MKKICLFAVSLFLLFAGCGNQDTDAPAPGGPAPVTGLEPFVEEEPVPPELVSPENNATVFEEKPLLSWTEVPGRGSYVVEIHQNENMEAPGWSDYVQVTEWRISDEFAGLDHEETYYWRVRRGMSDWSETRSFTVDLSGE
jgi:hypothetical protein